jgi:hypothetical protein
MQFALCFVICLEFGASPACYSELSPSGGAAPAVSQTVLDQVNILKAIGEGLEKIGNGFGVCWDKIKTAVIDIDAAWNVLTARRLHGKLVDLNVQLTIHAAAQTEAVEDIDEYVKNPTPQGWVLIRQKLKNVFDKVKELVETLKNDRSDFVIGPLYKELYDTLNQRVRPLESLQVMSPPQTKEELDQVRLINERYKRLVEQMNKTRTLLDEWLEKQKTRTTSKSQ